MISVATVRGLSNKTGEINRRVIPCTVPMLANAEIHARSVENPQYLLRYPYVSTALYGESANIVSVGQDDVVVVIGILRESVKGSVYSFMLESLPGEHDEYMKSVDRGRVSAPLIRAVNKVTTTATTDKKDDLSSSHTEIKRDTTSSSSLVACKLNQWSYGPETVSSSAAIQESWRRDFINRPVMLSQVHLEMYSELFLKFETMHVKALPTVPSSALTQCVRLHYLQMVCVITHRNQHLLRPPVHKHSSTGSASITSSMSASTTTTAASTHHASPALSTLVDVIHTSIDKHDDSKEQRSTGAVTETIPEDVRIASVLHDLMTRHQSNYDSEIEYNGISILELYQTLEKTNTDGTKYTLDRLRTVMDDILVHQRRIAYMSTPGTKRNGFFDARYCSLDM